MSTSFAGRDAARNFRAAFSTPFLCEEDGMLSLHFYDGDVQSQMQIRAPDLLTIGYTKTMMGFLLFNSRPRRIGMIGLGGGSIPKYCYRYLPRARISIAEISPEVIALRRNFRIPNDNSRFKVFCEDGADFVAHRPNQFDVLLVDGFDASGQPEQLCSRRFYHDCYDTLSANGLMVVNLYDARFEILLSRARQSFGNQVIVVGTDDGDNKVAFAGKGNALSQSERQYEKRLARLSRRHPIDLAQLAADIRCQQEADWHGAAQASD